jgi:hypothetical protein
MPKVLVFVVVVLGLVFSFNNCGSNSRDVAEAMAVDCMEGVGRDDLGWLILLENVTPRLLWPN